MSVTCDIVLHDRDKMTSRFTSHNEIDGTITVWPTWTGNEGVSLRLSASPEKLAELRDLINSALSSNTEPLEREKQSAVLSRPDRWDGPQ